MKQAILHVIIVQECVSTLLVSELTSSLQSIQVKNISPAQREKPHNEIEILLEGESVVEILEKELVALSGTSHKLDLQIEKHGFVLKRRHLKLIKL